MQHTYIISVSLSRCVNCTAPAVAPSFSSVPLLFFYSIGSDSRLQTPRQQTHHTVVSIMRRHFHDLLVGIAAICILLPTTCIDAFTLRLNPVTVTRSSHRISSFTALASASPSPSVVERLDLADNFNRWRFLQHFLDAEIQASDANQVLYCVLDAFVKYPPPADLSETVSPLATPDVCDTIQELLSTHNNGSIPAFSDPDCRPGNAQVLEKLETLLPDPRENEDAHKGSWDTVLELHGREAVKINERKATPEWKAICMVARLLIYFDFMTRGVPTS